MKQYDLTFDNLYSTTAYGVSLKQMRNKMETMSGGKKTSTQLSNKFLFVFFFLATETAEGILLSISHPQSLGTRCVLHRTLQMRTKGKNDTQKMLVEPPNFFTLKNGQNPRNENWFRVCTHHRTLGIHNKLGRMSLHPVRSRNWLVHPNQQRST